jgi:hypothetical protein
MKDDEASIPPFVAAPGPGFRRAAFKPAASRKPRDVPLPAKTINEYRS